MYSITKSETKYKEMKDTKDREIVDLRDELTASKGRCEVVESELAQIYSRYVRECPHMSQDLILHILYCIILTIEFVLMHSSCGGLLYSLTNSGAKYKEMKDTKERKIVALRDELAKMQRRYDMFVSVHTCHNDTIPIMISL